MGKVRGMASNRNVHSGAIRDFAKRLIRIQFATSKCTLANLRLFDGLIQFPFTMNSYWMYHHFDGGRERIREEVGGSDKPINIEKHIKGSRLEPPDKL